MSNTKKNKIQPNKEKEWEEDSLKILLKELIC